jgi:serine/threonine-protein kinase
MAKAPRDDRPTNRDRTLEDPFDLCGVTIQDKYRVASVIGSGGFGVVYRGVHTGFGEPIAVKCLKLPLELGEKERAELLTRLQDEGRVLHRLSRSSSGIVQALDVGAVTSPSGQWVPYLVLEWLEGHTLAEHLRERLRGGKGALGLEEAVELLEPAARALGVAHKQKIAHRDVKPENLYITEMAGQRTVKVLDFGIAKVLSEHATFTAAPAATQKQSSAFTPSYGAPEQFNKKRGATGPWTDVFALALILVEAVSGERALEGDDATQLYIAAADPASRPTLRYHGVETSDAVEQVLARALSIDPADRYQDAASFWDALQRALGQKPRQAPPPVDVSETGDFVSRHDIEFAATELSAVPSDVVDELDDPHTRRERSEPGMRAAARAPSDPPRRPSGAAPAADAAARAKRSDPPRKEASEGGLRARAAAAPAGSRPQAARPAQRQRSAPGLDARREPAAPTNTTTIVRPASARWLPVVVVLALVGAVVLWIQLRNIGDDDRDPLRNPSGGTLPSRRTMLNPSGGPSPSASDALDEADAGDDAGDADAGDAAVAVPDGMVMLSRGRDGPHFFFDLTEVTTGAYRECVSAGRCVKASRIVVGDEALAALEITGTTPEQLADSWRGRCNEARGEVDHPVNCVNHGSAADYCRFRDKRLPTSEEWQVAATGRETRRFSWGDHTPDCKAACFGLQNSCLGTTREVATCPVGSRRDKTPVDEIVDLSANVTEWVADEAAAQGAADGPWRMSRGGSFIDEADRIMTTTARALPAVTAHVTIGFRCARDVPSEDENPQKAPGK